MQDRRSSKMDRQVGWDTACCGTPRVASYLPHQPDGRRVMGFRSTLHTMDLWGVSWDAFDFCARWIRGHVMRFRSTLHAIDLWGVSWDALDFCARWIRGHIMRFRSIFAHARLEGYVIWFRSIFARNRFKNQYSRN